MNVPVHLVNVLVLSATFHAHKVYDVTPKDDKNLDKTAGSKMNPTFLQESKSFLVPPKAGLRLGRAVAT